MDLFVRKFVNENNLQPGDAIVAKKIGYGVLDHFIVYLGNDYSNYRFMANSKQEGVRRYKEDEIIELVKSFEPIRIRRFKGSNYERQLAVERALSQEGQPYSLLGSNCEHFANYVQKRVKDSPQVGGWISIGILALILGTITLSNNK